MKKHAFLKTGLSLFAAGLILAGCSSARYPESYKGAMNLPKNEVDVSTTSHTINLGQQGALSDEEKTGILNFLMSQGVAYGDELILDFAKSDQAWSTKMAAIGDFLKQHGYWIKYASQTGSVAYTNQAVLNVNRYSVVSPDCKTMASATFKPGEMWNDPSFGCVTAYNLGLMVANPQDLIEGQPDELPGTYRSVRAIQLYRARVGMSHVVFSPTVKNDIRIRVEGQEDSEAK